MKCMTLEEARPWLDEIGVQVDAEAIDLGSLNENQFVSRISAPTIPSQLPYFSYRLMDWLPNKGQRMFFIERWMEYPSERIRFFEAAKMAHAADRPLSEAPFHLFEIGDYPHYESRTAEQEHEEAILCGLVMLAICFDWRFYIFAADSNDYVFFSDAHALFSTDDPARAQVLPSEDFG